MELNRPTVNIEGKDFEIITLEEFRDRKNDPDLSTPTITYAMKNDKLDYVLFGRIKHIVWNDKAKNWKPGGGRPRRISKLST